MEIVITPNKLSPGTSDLITRHGVEELLWPIAQTTLQKEFDIFAEINAYWKYCSENLQSEIFNCYKEIYEQFNSYITMENTSASLKPCVAKLLELHDQGDIKYWVNTRSSLLIPSSIQSEFVSNTTATWTREKTYLRSDYQNLIPMTIALKSMIPVWEDFISRTKKDSGVFKDYQAFQLLSNSGIYNCDTMIRLAVFVEHTIPRDQSLDSAILAGISSEDFPRWVLSSIVVKHLVRADIRGNNPDLTIITSLHHSITQKTKSIDSSYGGIIDKRNTVNNYGEENNHSFIEDFRIKEEIAAGDITTVSEYLRRAVDQLKGIIPNTPRSLISRLNSEPDFIDIVRICYANAQCLRNEHIHPSQVILATWVLARFISPRAAPYLVKSDIITLIAFATAYLWKNGHYDLAGLVCASTKNNDGYMDNTISDTRSRMPKESMSELETIFPFTRRISMKSRSKTAKHANVAINTIDREFVDSVANQVWTLNLPEDWICVINSNAKIRRFLAPQDIRAKLAKLMLELEAKRIEQVREEKAIINS